MKCPYCGEDMISGMLNNVDDVYWTSAESVEEKGFFKSLISSIKSTKHIEVPMEDGEDGWFCMMLEVPAYHCPQCQFFLFRGRLEKD